MYNEEYTIRKKKKKLIYIFEINVFKMRDFARARF